MRRATPCSIADSAPPHRGIWCARTPDAGGSTDSEARTRQIGMESAVRSPQLLIVDGQQRLTSLFAVLTGRPVLTKSFEQRRIRIAFRPEDQTFEVADAAIDRDAHFIPDITALWS